MQHQSVTTTPSTPNPSQSITTTTTMTSSTMSVQQQQEQEDWDDKQDEDSRNELTPDFGRSASPSCAPRSSSLFSTTFAAVLVCFVMTLSLLYLLPRRRFYNSTTDNLLSSSSTSSATTTARFWTNKRTSNKNQNDSIVDISLNDTVSVNHSNDETTESTVQIDDETSSSSSSSPSSDFYDTIWPPIQRTLCPDRRPELLYTQILFAIGRYEFGLSDKPEKPAQLPSKFIQKFFVGGFGGVSIYIGGKGHNDNDDDGQPQLKTMYIRIWKCGNNQVRHFEKQLWQKVDETTKIRNNGTYIERINLIDAIHKYPQLTEDRRGGDGGGGGNGSSSLCTYTVVRDPVSHFLSGYNEADYRLVFSHKDRPGYNWTTPTPYFNISFTESDSSRRRRLTQLVEDVLLEKDELTTHYVFQHFFSMSRVLPWLHSSKVNLTLTGYIPSLQNLEQTWPQFMSNTCHGIMPSSVSEVPTKQHFEKLPGHRSSKDKLGLYQASKDVWSTEGHVSRALCAIHAMDYACWTDLPDGIPQICQDVYSTDIFRESILNYR